MVWVFVKKVDNFLFMMVEMFFNKVNDSGVLEDLWVWFFGYCEFDYVGVWIFLLYLDLCLVNYEEEFKINVK